MHGLHVFAAAGSLDLAGSFTSFQTWTISNLGPAAGIVVIIGLLILVFGGFSQKWGQKAVQIMKYPVIALFGFAFLPTLLSLFFTLVGAFGGSNVNSITAP